MDAVTAVLQKDPALAVTPLLISQLTTEQCRNIAHEIVYGPQPALPVLPDTLEDMYSTPPNDTTIANTHEQKRLQFQGQLSGYYGTLDAVAISMANFLAALSGAVYCEIQTQNATEALVEFPVNPNALPPPSLTTEPESAVIFEVAAGQLDVPASYFYALTYDMSIQVTKDNRFAGPPTQTRNRI